MCHPGGCVARSPKGLELAEDPGTPPRKWGARALKRTRPLTLIDLKCCDSRGMVSCLRRSLLGPRVREDDNFMASATRSSKSMKIIKRCRNSPSSPRWGYAGHCFGLTVYFVAAPRVARKGEAWWAL
jgi:hypothetical protein